MLVDSETRRLEALRELAIMDTPPDARLDEVTALAAAICGTPIALITLLDETRQWFKSRVGLEQLGTPREHAFCRHALNGPELLVVHDALADVRFVANPLVTGDPRIRFYAGAPLLTPTGEILGTLCVIDRVPRQLDPLQLQTLRVLSRQVMAELQLRRAAHEQDRLRQRLEQQNHELIEAQAVAKVGSWVTDLFTYEVRWSLQTHRIFGTEPDTFPLSHAAFIGRVHPDDRAAVDAAFAESTMHGEPRAISHRIVLPSGETRLVEERWQVFRNELGEPLEAIGTCHDITEQRDAESKALRLNRVYALLSGINDAIVHVHTRDALFARVCELAVENGGLRAAWIGVVTPDRPEVSMVAHAGRIAPYLNAQRITWTNDHTGQEPTGRAIREGRPAICNDVLTAPAYAPWREEVIDLGYQASACFPLRHADRMYGVLTLYADTTGFFDATEVELLDELVANIAFALHAIEQAEQREAAKAEREHLEQQLLRAQRLESIGTLAGGIAHDLNNVLTPIIFSIDLLRDGLQEPDLDPVLDEIARSARRGADMVRQLLLFARGTDGERRPTALEPVLHDLVATMQETFPRSIDIRAAIEPDLGWVLGDATQIHQVVLNLCVNARDAMSTGGVLQITAGNEFIDEHAVVLHPDAKVGLHVVLEVADTGDGMTPEVLARIYDPFFTTKALGEGTGLGLSTSRSIVASHGGFIQVYSEPGHGTRFRVGFPAVARIGAPPSPGEGARLPRGEGESILLVDDEAPIRAVASTLLTSYGYRVTVASNGAEAMRLFLADPEQFDVLVTDLMMPVMDGVQLIQRVRELRPEMPVIASSGFHDESRRQSIDAERVSAFLPKPYTTQSMLTMLRSVLVPVGVL